VKGLYKKARSGEIKNMTGISAPYEAPLQPKLEVITDGQPIESNVKAILKFLNKKVKI
jgi:adenylylsulfate kinase